jgi:ABC-type hemin transport system substrate-binding protein
MAYTVKNLANGQLPNSIGDLYEVPGSTTAIVRSITLVNTNTTAETVNLYYLKAAGTARRIIPKDLSLVAANSITVDIILTLGAGDKIQGQTTTASKVDFVISGVESV